MIQVSINGALMEDNAAAAKCTNAEVKLSTDQGWYKNEGSFCGFGLLNNELTFGPAPTTASLAAAAAATPPVPQQPLQQYNPAWGDITANSLAADARQSQAPNTVPWNPFGGEARTMPLGLISGVGRMKQYMPLSVFGLKDCQCVC
jgi:hypothetical protein